MKRIAMQRGAALALVVGAVAIGIWLKWPHERLLTEVARPIVKMDQQKEQDAWISANQLLLVTTERRAEIKERNDESIDRNWQGAADLLNTTTGVRTRLSGLTALFQQVTEFPMQSPVESGATFQQVGVSSQQQSIFYYLQISQTSPFLNWLHRISPKLGPKPTVIECLWVSRTDGSGLHEIGHVPAKLDSDGDPEDLLDDIQWLPNGKQISFVYHGILYVVPADPGSEGRR